MRSFVAAALVLSVSVAAAQAPASAPAPAASAAGSTPGPASDCPNAQDVQAHQLVGLWRADVEGAWQGAATVRLEPHPDYAGSLSGEIRRGAERARVAADLEDGEFTLEESADGVHIAATWLGDVVDGSCGREIRGSWEPASGDKRAFVMRRAQR